MTTEQRLQESIQPIRAINTNLAAETQAAIDDGAFDRINDFRVVPHRHDRAARLKRYTESVRDQQVRLGLSQPAVKQFVLSYDSLLYAPLIATGDAYRFHAAWVTRGMR